MQSWQTPSIPQVAGAPRPLRLYDTAPRETRPTTPGATAPMYVCGIPPYDATPLGHAATYLAFDLVHRQWLDNGHAVHYVQNVTDIDDPLLERAERDSADWVVLAMRETALFREDMEALRVVPPRDYIGAVEAIPEITEVVAKLLTDGVAYRVDDAAFPDVYYDHTARPTFGYESNYDQDTMLRFFGERGGGPGRPGQTPPRAPPLWRMAPPDEPRRGSELGAGRPGRHVQGRLIALDRLGLSLHVH